jgi:hypothetical protein
MADHPDVVFLHDSAGVGHGWRPKRMVPCIVGSNRGGCDGNGYLGLGLGLDLGQDS